MDANDIYISTGGNEGYIRNMQTDTLTNVTRAIWSIRLRVLQGRIHTALYSDIKRNDASPIWSRDSVIELHQEIEQWNVSLPPLPSPTSPALSLFMTSDWASLVYNQAILHLYRPQLTRPQQNETDDADIFLTCSRAASEVCSAFRRQYFKKQTTFTWGAVHELFLAGLTFIYCVRRSTTVRTNLGSEYISRTCTDCTIAFVILAERSKDALPYRDLFEALSSSTLNFISERPSTNFSQSSLSGSQATFTAAQESFAIDVPDFQGIFANFSEEVNAPAQVDDLLDAILVDWS